MDALGLPLSFGKASSSSPAVQPTDQPGSSHGPNSYSTTASSARAESSRGRGPRGVVGGGKRGKARSRTVASGGDNDDAGYAGNNSQEEANGARQRLFTHVRGSRGGRGGGRPQDAGWGHRALKRPAQEDGGAEGNGDKIDVTEIDMDQDEGLEQPSGSGSGPEPGDSTTMGSAHLPSRPTAPSHAAPAGLPQQSTGASLSQHFVAPSTLPGHDRPRQYRSEWDRAEAEGYWKDSFVEDPWRDLR